MRADIQTAYLDRDIDERLLDEIELLGELRGPDLQNFLRRVRAIVQDRDAETTRADNVADMARAIHEDVQARVGSIVEEVTDLRDRLADRLEALENELED